MAYYWDGKKWSLVAPKARPVIKPKLRSDKPATEKPAGPGPDLKSDKPATPSAEIVEQHNIRTAIAWGLVPSTALGAEVWQELEWQELEEYQLQ
jgi:hypothetical protein